MTKPFEIPKMLVWKAFQRVKANGGSAGVDQESIEEFEQKVGGNLYKLWNRMASGSYFPPPVKAVPIPKKSGGTRLLGVPTVADRVAQTVVKMVLEPMLEPVFDRDSFGYRPGRSALDAVGLVRRRNWEYDWVVEFDIKGLFDNIDHELLLRAVRKHCGTAWVLLYIERWLKAPMQTRDGTLVARDRGTPQGGVVSPLLANLFLHYALDVWMRREMRSVRFCRYADDGVIHCRSEVQARLVLRKLGNRLRECGLELHPEKTKIVYCRDVNRTCDYPSIQFTFLGYTFRPRKAVDKYGRVYVNFSRLSRRICGWIAAGALFAERSSRSWYRVTPDLPGEEVVACCTGSCGRGIGDAPLYRPAPWRRAGRTPRETRARWAMAGKAGCIVHAGRFLRQHTRCTFSLSFGVSTRCLDSSTARSTFERHAARSRLTSTFARVPVRVPDAATAATSAQATIRLASAGSLSSRSGAWPCSSSTRCAGSTAVGAA